MTFPTVQATANGDSGGNLTTHTIPLPSGVVSGNLLLVFISCDGSGSFSNWTNGFTELGDWTVGSVTVGCAYKQATGGETSVDVDYSVSERGAYLSFRIDGHEDPSVQPPEISTGASATSGANPDPDSLSPTGGAKDYLWIGMAGWRLDDETLTAYPSNYTSNQNVRSIFSGGTIALSTRNLNVSSENPGAYTKSGSSREWIAATIAVHPAGGAAVTLTPAGIASAEAFGTDVLNRALAAAGIASAESFGAHDLIFGNTILPAGIASAEAFGPASLSFVVLPAASRITSAVHVYIGDLAGRVITDIEAMLGPVSWRLNDYGKLTLILSKNDPALKQEYFEFGNRILVYFDNGLPAWGGIIDTPRIWTDADVEITAYSGEILLDWRISHKAHVFQLLPAGAMFRELILAYMSELGVELGTVWVGSEVASLPLHLNNLLDVTRDDLTRRRGAGDFVFTPRLEQGQIRFVASFFEHRGNELPGTALIEGHNAVGVRLRETGPIRNEIVVAGSDLGGSDNWGPTRLVGWAENGNSAGRYGRRQAAAVQTNVDSQETLDTIATNLLGAEDEPRKLVELEAVNLAPARFADYDVGDSITIHLPTFGFGGTSGLARVTGREYFPADGICNLILEEVME